MNTQPHFEELLKLLEENQVEYVIVTNEAAILACNNQLQK